MTSTTADQIEWVAVKDRFGNKLIGAIGFVGDEPAVVLCFYETKDANKDGKVSAGEWIAGTLAPVSLTGTAVLEVVSRAREQAILAISSGGSEARAAKLSAMQGQQFVKTGLNMALDGIFKAYISTPINLLGGAIGQHIGADMIKEMAIKKGMEKAAKAAFDAAVK